MTSFSYFRSGVGFERARHTCEVYIDTTRSHLLRPPGSNEHFKNNSPMYIFQELQLKMCEDVNQDTVNELQNVPMLIFLKTAKSKCFIIIFPHISQCLPHFFTLHSIYMQIYISVFLYVVVERWNHVLKSYSKTPALPFTCKRSWRCYANIQLSLKSNETLQGTIRYTEHKLIHSQIHTCSSMSELLCLNRLTTGITQAWETTRNRLLWGGVQLLDNEKQKACLQ